MSLFTKDPKEKPAVTSWPARVKKTNFFDFSAAFVMHRLPELSGTHSTRAIKTQN
jgi:hypothetical protein